MANYLYITRAAQSFESDEFPLDLAEWTAFAEADSRLEPDDGGDALDWVFSCADGTEAYLSWKRHFVEVRGTDANDVDLAALARDLNARLVDGDGDEYNLDGTTTPWSDSRRPIVPR